MPFRLFNFFKRMEEQIQISIKSGNDLTPYEAYAIKTVDGELAIGYYSDTKKVFKTDDHRNIPISKICVYANIEELQNKMNAFK